jgi:hypothetical protein
MSLFCSTGFRAALLGPTAFEGILNGGHGVVYAGPQPANADMDIGAAVAIARITIDGESIGVANGLTYARFGVHISNATTWTMRGTASGIASWLRLYGSKTDTGNAFSTSLARIDMPVYLTPASGESVSGSGFAIPSLTIDATTLRSIDGFYYTIPPL